MKGLTWPFLLTGWYLASLAALTFLNWSGADRFWLGALNLYLPQFIWALPGIILAAVFFRSGRSWTWLPLVGVAWVAGPVMGFCWSLPSHQSSPQQLALRVMTWNIKYGSYDLAPLLEEITRRQPDVVLFQDAVDSLGGPLGAFFTGWRLYSHGQFVIASRYPLSGLEVHTLPRLEPGQEYLRCQLQFGGTAVSLYNVHLKTPRKSLNAFRTARKQPEYLPSAIETFDHNIETRLQQAGALADALGAEKGPVILAGDLNSPDSSRPCALLRKAGLHDAFAERGRGYGFTYGHFLFKHRLPWLKFSWMRIDNIMVSRHVSTRNCWAGTGQASDHRPVIADLVLEKP